MRNTAEEESSKVIYETRGSKVAVTLGSYHCCDRDSVATFHLVVVVAWTTTSETCWKNSIDSTSTA